MSEQQKVLLLARKGLDASEIAKSLKRPVGEVELILNLQRIAS
jgi:transcriptional regulator